ncbi:MAG: RecX family transcriptional regulator [Clostridiales bacterium]|nr:RecX family transcriptional regulator [Clostridiales bacterium]
MVLLDNNGISSDPGSSLRDCAVTDGIRHIGISTYSSGKVKDFLVNKGYSDNVASEAVAELISRKYIDDRKASGKVLRARSGKKQESKEYIFRRLLAAGIDENIAEDIVSELPSDRETCLILYESLGYSEDSEEVRDAMINMALKRGYEYLIADKAYSDWSEDL